MILPSVSDIPVLPFLDSSEDRDVAPATSGCTRGPTGPAARRISRPQVTAPVWRLDRLGRSLQHLIETIKDLEKREIGFKSLTENIDTTSSGGKLVFHIFGA